MFDRVSLEQILTLMFNWTMGITSKLTDFHVGSKLRTLYEAVGLVVEDLYDKVYRAIKVTIPANIYAVFDFSKIPATYASGDITFTRLTPADKDYLIVAGTMVYTVSTASTQALGYKLSADITLLTGTSSIKGLCVCTTAGSAGNTASNTITSVPLKPVGIDSVTNATAFSNGAEEETSAAQKARFQNFINAQAKGVLQSIEYGAELSVVADANSIVTEQVVQAVAFEYLPERKGEVDVYLWNGINGASAALIAAVKKNLYGYYDESGRAIFGFKPAGILANVYSVLLKNVTIKLLITPESWTDLPTVKPLAEAEIDTFFAELSIGQTLVQTALEALIKDIDGINDVKLSLSLDTTIFNDSNVTVQAFELPIAVKPILYA